MCSVIDYYVTQDVLSLESINERVRLFPLLDVKNRPPVITKNQLLKGALALSASELMNLILFFALMIGDLIPKDCEIWNYYLKLKCLFDLLSCKTLTKDHSSQLSVLIEEHHSMYSELFNKPLRPKHHFLTHYPSSLIQVGPFSHYWSMRFESKHTLLKCISNTVKFMQKCCYQAHVSICKQSFKDGK